MAYGGGGGFDSSPKIGENNYRFVGIVPMK